MLYKNKEKKSLSQKTLKFFSILFFCTIGNKINFSQSINNLSIKSSDFKSGIQKKYAKKNNRYSTPTKFLVTGIFTISAIGLYKIYKNSKKKKSQDLKKNKDLTDETKEDKESGSRKREVVDSLTNGLKQVKENDKQREAKLEEMIKKKAEICKEVLKKMAGQKSKKEPEETKFLILEFFIDSLQNIEKESSFNNQKKLLNDLSKELNSVLATYNQYIVSDNKEEKELIDKIIEADFYKILCDFQKKYNHISTNNSNHDYFKAFLKYHLTIAKLNKATKKIFNISNRDNQQKEKEQAQIKLLQDWSVQGKIMPNNQIFKKALQDREDFLKSNKDEENTLLKAKNTLFSESENVFSGVKELLFNSIELLKEEFVNYINNNETVKFYIVSILFKLINTIEDTSISKAEGVSVPYYYCTKEEIDSLRSLLLPFIKGVDDLKTASLYPDQINEFNRTSMCNLVEGFSSFFYKIFLRKELTLIQSSIEIVKTEKAKRTKKLGSDEYKNEEWQDAFEKFVSGIPKYYDDDKIDKKKYILKVKNETYSSMFDCYLKFQQNLNANFQEKFEFTDTKNKKYTVSGKEVNDYIETIIRRALSKNKEEVDPMLIYWYSQKSLSSLLYTVSNFLNKENSIDIRADIKIIEKIFKDFKDFLSDSFFNIGIIEAFLKILLSGQDGRIFGYGNIFICKEEDMEKEFEKFMLKKFTENTDSVAAEVLYIFFDKNSLEKSPEELIEICKEKLKPFSNSFGESQEINNKKEKGLKRLLDKDTIEKWKENLNNLLRVLIRYSKIGWITKNKYRNDDFSDIKIFNNSTDNNQDNNLFKNTSIEDFGVVIKRELLKTTVNQNFRPLIMVNIYILKKIFNLFKYNTSNLSFFTTLLSPFSDGENMDLVQIIYYKVLNGNDETYITEYIGLKKDNKINFIDVLKLSNDFSRQKNFVNEKINGNFPMLDPQKNFFDKLRKHGEGEKKF